MVRTSIFRIDISMNHSRLSFSRGAAAAISLLTVNFIFLAQGERAPQTDSGQAVCLLATRSPSAVKILREPVTRDLPCAISRLSRTMMSPRPSA